jgi:hypothetical protein
MTVKDQQD